MMMSVKIFVKHFNIVLQDFVVEVVYMTQLLYGFWEFDKGGGLGFWLYKNEMFQGL